MKRILVFMLVVLMASSVLMACSPAEEPAAAEVPNPMVEYDSVEKVNELVGFDMVLLPDELGYVPVKLYIIDKTLAQIDYSDRLEDAETADETEKVNITLRMQKGGGDISGIYGVKNYESESFNGISVNMGKYEDILVAWFEEGGFAYSATATGIDAGTFDKVVGAMAAAVKPVE